MANKIQFNDSDLTNTFRKGNFRLATNYNLSSPTHDTGFNVGLVPNGGEYIIYEEKDGFVDSGLTLFIDPSNSSSYNNINTLKIKDLSGLHDDADFINGVTYSGSSGGVLITDGSNDIIQFETPNSNIFNGDYSICFWVNVISRTASGAIIDTFFNSAYCMRLYYDSNLKLKLNHYSSYTDPGASSVSGTTIYLWEFWTFTYTSSNKTVNIYKNLEFDSSSVLNRDEPVTEKLSISAPPNGSGSSFDNIQAKWGLLSIYNRVISLPEIHQNYNYFRERFFNLNTNGLILYLDAEKYSNGSNIWYDLSGNGNDFTVDSGMTWGDYTFNLINGQQGISLVTTGVTTSSTTCTVVMWIKTTDDTGLFLHRGTGGYLGAYKSSSKEYYSQVGTPDFYMDTIERDNIYDYFPDGEWHMVEFKNVNLSNLYNIQFNQYDISFDVYNISNGKLGLIQIYDRNLTTEESLTNYNYFKNRFCELTTDNLVLNLDASNLSSYPGTGTTWYDLSGNNNDGTLTNTPTYNNNGYFDFNGINEYVDMSFHYFPWGGITTSTTGVTTLESWFKTTNTDDISYHSNPIFGALEDASLASVGVNNGVLTIRYYDYDTPSWTGVTVSDFVSDGKWHHAVFVLNPVSTNDDGYCTVYLDGQMTEYKKTMVGFRYNWFDALGKNRYDRYFDGSIAYANVYTRELTNIEIINNFNITRRRFGL